MARLGGFWRAGLGPAKPASPAAGHVKDWTRAALGLDEDATVSVNEIVCADPACPGSETVILVMRPGHRTRAVKVSKALEEVSEADVTAALASV